MSAPTSQVIDYCGQREHAVVCDEHGEPHNQRIIRTGVGANTVVAVTQGGDSVMNKAAPQWLEQALIDHEVNFTHFIADVWTKDESHLDDTGRGLL